MVCMQQLLTPKQENLYLMEMLSGSTDFETPQPRFSIIELPGSDIQREGTLKKLKVSKSCFHFVHSTILCSKSLLHLQQCRMFE